MRLFVLLLCLATAAVAQDQKKQEAAKPAASQTAPTPPAAPTSLGQVLERQVTGLERGFVALADAMPEDKFDFKPPDNLGEFNDVRTFAQQVKHVAAGMHMLAATLTGQKPPYTVEQATLGPAEFKTKAEILAFLKDGFAKAKAAVAGVNDKNALDMLPSPFSATAKSSRLAQANIIVWHGFDHYGQMVVYARMNNIVPPASRN
jgi:hypothetical protein